VQVPALCLCLAVLVDGSPRIQLESSIIDRRKTHFFGGALKPKRKRPVGITLVTRYFAGNASTQPEQAYASRRAS